MTNKKWLGEKQFLEADQLAFAALSGDHNPMHMDDIEARKLLTGRRVVHGIHLLLWAVEYWMEKNPGSPAGMKCEFKNPVSVGDRVLFDEESLGPAKSVIRIFVDGLPCMKIQLTLGESGNGIAAEKSGSGVLDLSLMGENEAYDRAPAEQVGQEYRMAVFPPLEASAFPQLQSRLGSDVVSAIASLSRFVGMVCPGLHSLFASVDIQLASTVSPAREMVYRVDEFDERFGLFYIRVAGPVAGRITAFQRPAPVKQVSVATLVQHLQPAEFVGKKSLVLGGSRGLGEYTAKLLVAGGAEVVISYAQGLQDAQRVSDELNTFRQGSCALLPYDVRNNLAEVFAQQDVNTISSVYFFATPKIYRKKPETFSLALFEEFCAFYVAGFYGLCEYFEKNAGHPVTFFLPSSVFVTEVPAGFVEYAMAKAAAEVLAKEINQSCQKVSVVVSRLPRMATDQTAAVTKVTVAETLETLLPVVRQVQQANT